MKNRLETLGRSELNTLGVVRTFVSGRLADPEILDWATKLGASHRAERIGFRMAVSHTAQKLTPAWRDAWQLLFEAWESGEEPDRHAGDEYAIAQRVADGERSGDLVTAIVELVRPVLIVKSRVSAGSNTARLRRARNTGDLVSVDIEAHHPIDPLKLGVDKVNEAAFLEELAIELDAALSKTLSIARRIGQADNPWKIGIPRRVYWVSATDLDGDEHEPDEFSTGVAAVTKLLFAVLTKLSNVDLLAAKRLVARWGGSAVLLYERLWAAAARDARLASASEVALFLTHCNADVFWSVDTAPEVAELRATRFADLPSAQQEEVALRIRKGPPRSYWSSNVDAETIRMYRVRRIARELQRIELGAGGLPEAQARWMREQFVRFPDLELEDVDDDFYTLKRARWVGRDPDARFDGMTGEERLVGLERALAEDRVSWRDDPAERASDWIRNDRNAALVIGDLRSTQSVDFPRVLERVTWAHRPRLKDGEQKSLTQESAGEADQMLGVLEMASTEVAIKAIDGLSSWLDDWAKFLHGDARFERAWLRFWPIAVTATNSQAQENDDPLNTVVRGGDAANPEDLDTLNSAVGRMVGAFLALCPTVKRGDHPFEGLELLRRMRGEIENASGRAGLIGRYRLTQGFGYFLLADENWTKTVLVPPLLREDREARILWRAIASDRRLGSVVALLGAEFMRRAIDPRMGRKVRASLAISLVLEVLHALNERKPPKVDVAGVTQMLRSVDEDVRVEVAQIIQRFLAEMPAQNAGAWPPEGLYDRAVKPFLSTVWPQEVAVSSPAVSRALVDIPSYSGERFADAVHLLRSKLVPFESWTLLDYGLRDAAGNELSKVNSQDKAEAFLDLLDATISGADGVAVPMELADALTKISTLSARSAARPSYRRLSALARR